MINKNKPKNYQSTSSQGKPTHASTSEQKPLLLPTPDDNSQVRNISDTPKADTTCASSSTSTPEVECASSNKSSNSRISIKMKFRPSKKEGSEGVIYIQFIQDRITTKVNTPYRILSSEWDQTNGKIIVTDENSKRSAELRSLSSNITWDLSILERLSQNNKNVESLINDYRNFKALGDGSLFEFIRKHINKLNETGRFRASETYLCTLNSFMRYRGGVDLTFEMLNRNLVEDYQKYLHHLDLTKNTISFYMRKLRAIYNMAVEDELCPDVKPFSSVFTGNAPTKKRAICREILHKIAVANLSEEPKLEFARDIFLLILYLQGISFVDLAYMPCLNDDTEILTYNRKKTGSPISIFLEPEAKEIIKKYQGEDSRYMLSIITSTDPKIARQQCLNALARINYSLEKLVEKLGLKIHLTTYSARHSWATLALANGANMDTISQALGHKDLKTTRIYIDSIHSDAITKANRGVLDCLKDE